MPAPLRRSVAATLRRVPKRPPQWTFLDIVYVRCPRCQRRASIHTREGATQLACPHCGHSAAENSVTIHFSTYAHADDIPFGAPLWLETECCGGNRLWAMNERHLDYLAAFVGEKQRNREFPSPAGNRQLSYKLPTWMKLAKNREEILHAIERLRSIID